MRTDRRRRLAAVWLGTAVMLGALLGVAQASRGPLDDPDQAHQRVGFLDAGPLPAAAPATITEAVAARPAVAFFVREQQFDALCDALAPSSLDLDAVIVVVHRAGEPCGGAAVVADDGDVAAAVGLRRPAGGGYPVGYAALDDEDRIRYRTLDPGLAGRLDEVATILDAVR
ncbi:MAG: hypothetical protein ACT4PW_14140 [Acidimicrobiia bacterium]